VHVARVRDSSPVLAGVAAASVLLGVLAVARPGVAVGVSAAAVALAAVAAVERRATVLPRRPVDIALVAVVIYLPFAPYISTLWPSTASLLRATLALYIAFGLLLGVIPAKRPIGAHGRWLIVAFAAYQLVALVGVPGSAYSAARAINWVMFVPLAFVRLDQRSQRVLVAAALVSGAVLVFGVALQLAGLIGFTWGGLTLGGAGQFEHHARRYTSFTLNPNDLGLAMLILAVVVHAVTRERTTTWRLRLLGSLLASVCLAVVFMTSSRGALIGLVLLGFYWFAIARRTGHYPVAVITGVVVALIALPFLVPSVAPSINKAISSVPGIFHGSDDSAQARRLRWGDVLGSDRNFVTGVGYGGFGDAPAGASVLAVSGTQDSGSLTIDNGWLKLLLEEGLVGVLLFASVILAGVRSALGAMRHGAARVPAVIASSILLLMAFRGASVDSFDINPWNAVLWLALALSYSDAAEPDALSARRPGLLASYRVARRGLGARTSTTPDERLA
jgi:O-antigen ligase